MPKNLRHLLIILAVVLAFTPPAPAANPPAATAPAGAVPAQVAPGEAADEDEDAGPTAAVKPDPATDKFWEAVRLLKSGRKEDQTAGAAALKAASDLEYVYAQELLAHCYFSGAFGFSQNQSKSANLYRLAAARGDGYAMVNYGSMVAAGIGTSANDEVAAKWLTAAIQPTADYSRPTPPPDIVAAEAKSATASEVAGTLVNDPASQARAGAHYVLGLIYAKQKKLAEAQEQFVAAATAGPNGSCGNLNAATIAAVNYAFGTGVPRDLEKANAMIAQSRKLVARGTTMMLQNSIALKLDDSFAGSEMADALSELSVVFGGVVQRSIAQQLSDKKAKTYDPKEAAKWYTLAADSGQVWAMVPAAFNALEGTTAPPNPTEAFKWFDKAGGGSKPKDLTATADLAICYLNGIGTAKDPAKAAAIFKKYKEANFACYLGWRGEPLSKPLKPEEIFALNRKWVKDKKDPQAQYLLSLAYLFGFGVEEDGVEADTWLKRAAKGNYGAALCMLGAREISQAMFMKSVGVNFTESDLKSGIEHLRKSAEAGHPEGALRYGALFHLGTHVPKDLAKAESLYLKAAQLDPDYAEPHNNLAVIYEDRLRQAVAQGDEKAAAVARSAMLEQYDLARKLGSVLATANLGILHYDGILVPKDLRKAYAEFEEAAGLGSTSAHYHLGLMHEQGDGVPVTYTEAAYHYRIAALDGHKDSLRRLINFYITGQGVSPDLDRAIFWLNRLVALGNDRVFTTYCDVLLRKGAYDKALKLLNDLKESKDNTVSGYAYYRLAYCYSKGLGVKANAAKSERYRQGALQRGDGNALAEVGLEQINNHRVEEGLANLRRAAVTSRHANYALGMMYLNGTNVPKDEAKGIAFLKVAAEANHTEALYVLAVLTYEKRPGAPSLDQAIDFAQRAETNGHAKGAALRETLEQRRKGASASGAGNIP